MMNKCVKFHKDSPSDKKKEVKLERNGTFGDGRFCVQLCIETLCKRTTSVAHLTNFSFAFFNEIFTEDASLLFLYHGAKKSKMTKNSNQGGPALTNLAYFERGHPSLHITHILGAVSSFFLSSMYVIAARSWLCEAPKNGLLVGRNTGTMKPFKIACLKGNDWCSKRPGKVS